MNTDCRTEIGITVGLIDSLICISRVVRNRDLYYSEVQEAIADLRSTDDIKMLMDIGELSSAREYIEDQRKIIEALTSALELANSLNNQQ